MLGHTYRYQAFNNNGSVAVTVTVKERAWKFGTDGSKTDASEATRINASSVSAGAYGSSSTVDNSSDKNLGSDITWTAAPASSMTGAVHLYIQRSTDGGTTWPANGQGIALDTISFAASSASVTKNAEVR